MIELVFGCLGAMLLVAAVVLRCAPRIGLALAAAVILVIPVGELLVVEYVRAAIGDLSIVTQILLAVFLVGHVAERRLMDERQLGAVLATALAAAVFLYPAALGVVQFDPYALGYASPYFVAALAALTLAAWYLRLEWLAACLLVAVAAKVAGVLESRNLWDYLVDPLLALYALFWLLRKATRRSSAAALSTP